MHCLTKSSDQTILVYVKDCWKEIADFLFRSWPESKKEFVYGQFEQFVVTRLQTKMIAKVVGGGGTFMKSAN